MAIKVEVSNITGRARTRYTLFNIIEWHITWQNMPAHFKSVQKIHPSQHLRPFGSDTLRVEEKDPSKYLSNKASYVRLLGPLKSYARAVHLPHPSPFRRLWPPFQGSLSALWTLPTRDAFSLSFKEDLREHSQRDGWGWHDTEKGGDALANRFNTKTQHYMHCIPSSYDSCSRDKCLSRPDRGLAVTDDSQTKTEAAQSWVTSHLSTSKFPFFQAESVILQNSKLDLGPQLPSNAGKSEKILLCTQEQNFSSILRCL